MIFSNQYTDYSSKTKKELYQTLILFSILSNKNLVLVGKIILKISLKLRLPILKLIKNTIFKQFCGGEDILESQKIIKHLGKFNIKTILDYSIEGKNQNSFFQKTYNEIMNNLEEGKKNPLIPFCVFKITGLASFQLLTKINQKQELSKKDQKEYEILKQRLDKIAQKAQKFKIPILIDAEESWIQDIIDNLAENMMLKYNRKDVIIYNTIQLYRWDKLDYIKQLHLKAKKEKFKLGLKLVRGAYMEKERNRAKEKKYKSPIHLNKNNCDSDFNSASKYCIENIHDMAICFGTHNEDSTKFIIDLMKENKIKQNDKRIYFAQLLGMSDNITFYLSHFNYNVAKYVPYGPVKEALPYLIRRAEENSSITKQTNREILRIKQLLKSN